MANAATRTIWVLCLVFSLDIILVGMRSYGREGADVGVANAIASNFFKWRNRNNKNVQCATTRRALYLLCMCEAGKGGQTRGVHRTACWALLAFFVVGLSVVGVAAGTLVGVFVGLRVGLVVVEDVGCLVSRMVPLLIALLEWFRFTLSVTTGPVAVVAWTAVATVCCLAHVPGKLAVARLRAHSQKCS